MFNNPKKKKTFGELGLVVKHKISHRFRALEKAKKIIQKYIEKQAVS
ncbi:MAG: non-canonical purine NTP pyrophosphatase [Candidatus Omnitrophica bacterium]|nr:non-canonical purine NTP pyrophosphatase [Candidatus Omnitrophota bacterium]